MNEDMIDFSHGNLAKCSPLLEIFKFSPLTIEMATFDQSFDYKYSTLDSDIFHVIGKKSKTYNKLISFMCVPWFQ